MQCLVCHDQLSKHKAKRRHHIKCHSCHTGTHAACAREGFRYYTQLHCYVCNAPWAESTKRQIERLFPPRPPAPITIFSPASLFLDARERVNWTKADPNRYIPERHQVIAATSFDLCPRCGTMVDKVNGCECVTCVCGFVLRYRDTHQVTIRARPWWKIDVFDGLIACMCGIALAAGSLYLVRQ